MNRAEPLLFRVVIQVANLSRAAGFYEALLGIAGRNVGGNRYYFDCGDVILALLDVSQGGREPQPIPDDLYFAVENIEEIYERASALDCLSEEQVHGQKAGDIVQRPWGERSFYAVDPQGNGLCFVDATTVFTGRERPDD